MTGYAWRLHADQGGHRLEQVFDTAADAGIWRRENFGVYDIDDPHRVRLTLVAVAGDQMFSPTWDELSAAQAEMLGIGLA